MEEIFTYRMDDFPRAVRLKEEVMKARPAVALERSKLLVDFHEREGFDLERPLLRQARALKHILENIEPRIFPEELLVGSLTEHRLGCVMFPEFQAGVIWPEILKLPRRRHHPVDVTDEAVEEFSFRIFPYFMEKNIHEWVKQRFGYADSIKLMERMVFYLVAAPNGMSHLIPDYPIGIRLGFNRIKQTARERREKIPADGKEAQEKRDFYEAIEIVSDGVIAYAKNHAKKCKELAGSESDPGRKAELEELARILEKVPAEPAETFQEALQSLWITHLAVMQENSDLAMSFGRMDQFLMPFYEKDMSEGRLDRKKALELLLCLYIKTNDHTPLVPTAGQSLFSGSATNQSITLSGLSPEGKDSTNELSYLFLRALDLLRLREPNVDARFHADSPQEWYEKVLGVIRSTGAAPALYNDEAVVPALVEKGATLEDARDYGVIGCVETTVQGKVYGMTGSILFNLAQVFELALYGGVHPVSRKQIGPETGSLSGFRTYDEFWRALCSQIEFMAGMSVDAEILYDKAHKELHPIPLLSALIDGPMEKGKDLTGGGATYNSSGVWVVGLADVVDSLAALKKLVFEEKKISPAEMEAALKADFKGFEKIQAMCANRAPRYGNDDEYADDIAVEVVNVIDRAYGKHSNYRGGPFHVGYWTMTMHTGYGRLIGALPSGRKKGRALASGATPVSGAASNGPSASLSSTAKLPPGPLANSIACNHKIPAYLLKEPEKMKVMQDLVRGYFRKGGYQVQFVIADKSMLEKALNDPEMAKDLLVRVSGYTAYFGDLDRASQLEIINRTEDVI